MPMKVSDYISQFLVDIGIKHIFLISGGGMMHLLDSVGKQEGLECIYNLNEQASGICGESYGQFTNKIGACMVTTGPGATNAITGCAGAWLDSTPVLYISGQCRIAQMGQLMGLRQYGAQEIAIIPCVKPITKYAEIVLDKNDIAYHLEKAYYLATHGRRGPAWIDVPLDIQGAQVNVDDLKHFVPEEDDYDTIDSRKIDKLIELLNESKRPLILIGHGAVASGIGEDVHNFCKEYSIPAEATWRAKGVFDDDERFYFGSPGIPSTRFSNYVLQNADLLLVIGSRLNAAITAYDEKHFAFNAKKIIVDIEEKEIDKLSIDFEMKFVCDAKAFWDAFVARKKEINKLERTKWLDYCLDVKTRYDISFENQPYDNEGLTDGYKFVLKLSELSKKDDVFVGSSSGRTCGISHIAYKVKRGQKFITSMGLGSMGWCIPSSIACCIVSGKKRTLVMEGDGSLQHNIQELQLIKTYSLPLKIFVWSNSGYASIYTMQRNNFESRFAGCNADCGLEFPKCSDVARTYGLDYYLIKNNDDINLVLKEVMKDNRPVLCEILASINFDEIPKSMTIANKDGSFSSSSLEYLYPFISEEEQKKNMPNWEE